jgi:hypothetical protein
MVTRRVFVRNALAVSAGTWAVALGLINLSGFVRSRFFPRRLPAPALGWIESLAAPDGIVDRVELGAPRRRALVADLERFLVERGADADAVAAALRERIRGDFTTGRLVVVDGWNLTETETALLLIRSDVQRGMYRAS